MTTRIIDTHCHIYPDKIANKAVDAVSTFYQGLSNEHHDGTTKTLLESGKKAGITGFVVCSVATTPHQVSSINHFIADAVKASEGAFVGLGAMHQDSENQEEDLKEIISLGLKGVKLHPDIQAFPSDGEKAFRMYELMEKYNLPLLIHAGDKRYDYSNPDRISHILRAFPKLTVIAAHLGGYSVWEEAARVLPDYPNVMVDTSSSFPCLTLSRARELIRMYGEDRVMFGTDYPLWTQRGDLNFMKNMELTEQEYEKIYWKNAAKLYNIPASDLEDQ